MRHRKNGDLMILLFFVFEFALVLVGFTIGMRIGYKMGQKKMKD